MQDFRNIRVWQHARAFKNRIYLLIARFPAHERYALSDQLRRSVRSIGANIAEGFGKSTRWDCARCLQTSLSEAGETLNHLCDATDLNYITSDEFTELVADLKILERRIGALYFKIRPSGRNRRHKRQSRRESEG